MTFISKEMTKKHHSSYYYSYTIGMTHLEKIPKVAVTKGDSYYDIREQFAST